MTPRLATPIRTEGTLTPLDVVRAWPQAMPLAALVSADDEAPDARWSILTSPAATVQFFECPCGDVRRTVIRHDPASPPPSLPDERASLADHLAWLFRPTLGLHHDSPFIGGWLGWLAYEAGGLFEPAARQTLRHPHVDDRPIAEWHWCPDAWVHDARSQGWWHARADGSFVRSASPHHAMGVSESARWSLGCLLPSLPREDYMARVARTIEYIRAGDIFQANIAHRLSASFSGSARSAFAALVSAAAPRHAAYFESPGIPRQAILSASPECFLRFDPRTRQLTTRPMKGTRPVHSPLDAERAASAGRDRRVLQESPKEQAELHMIVDLMRNDLGRVCRLGSVRVDTTREIERHGREGSGLWQAVATVSGVLRNDRTFADALAAAFPPGSITGAPKIRAMQIIDELESARRGPYCGCIGYVSRCGHAAMNVAIRTAVISGGGTPASNAQDAFSEATLRYGVGAGIVADSDPAAEWDETLLKARILDALANP